jgi:hypothetical protein
MHRAMLASPRGRDIFFDFGQYRVGPGPHYVVPQCSGARPGGGGFELKVESVGGHGVRGTQQAPGPRLVKLHGLCLLAVLLGLIACGDGPSTPSVTVIIEPGVLPELTVGDNVELTASLSDPAAVATWESSSPNVATVSDGNVEGLRPGTTWVVAMSGSARDSVAVTVVPRPGGFTAPQVDYFLEIAFGFEYGGASEIVRKWPGDVRIRVNGQPSDEDRAALDQVVAEINALTPTTDLVLVETEPEVELHLVPKSDFPDILPSYVPGNDGYFQIWWDSAQQFVRGVILIDVGLDQALRNHLIREEVTQSLGLANDSYLYPESIFYQAFSTVTDYAPVDEAVIEMLYRPEVVAGMDRTTAGRIVRRLTRQGTPQLISRPPLVAWVERSVAGSGSGSHRSPH